MDMITVMTSQMNKTVAQVNGYTTLYNIIGVNSVFRLGWTSTS